MAAHLHLEPPPARPDGSVVDQANWAADLLTVREAALTAADTAVGRLNQQRDAAAGRIAAALADASVDDPVALQEAIVQAASAASRAAEDITTATEQIPHHVDHTPLRELAAANGLHYATLRRRRLRAEQRLLAWLCSHGAAATRPAARRRGKPNPWPLVPQQQDTRCGCGGSGER
jgi:hypothetical protein